MHERTPAIEAARAQARRRFWWLMLVAGAIVALDLWTKHLASTHLELYRPVPLLSWFNLTLAHNYGAAFSFLGDQSGWQRWVLAALAAGISVFIVIWLWRLQAAEWLTGLALALVLGGAIGNLVDRVRLGYVVDFIDWHAAGRHWPAFNIADAAISCGVALMLIDALILAPRRQRRSIA